MEEEVVSASKIKPAEYNPRTISEFDYTNLKNNIQKFGCVVPLIVNKDYTLISGHQRYKAMLELGYKEFKVMKLNLSKDEEKLLNVSLNKISGEWDQEKLAGVLKTLNKATHFAFTGFSESELRNITKAFDFTEIAQEHQALNTQELNVMLWTAKMKQKEYNKVVKTLEKIKKDLNIEKYTSFDANGLILKQLCDNYEKRALG